MCYYIDYEPQYCWWDTVDSPKKRIKEGGGSANRVTARNACSSSEIVAYRSVVDVDLVGEVDPPDKLITPSIDLLCHP